MLSFSKNKLLSNLHIFVIPSFHFIFLLVVYLEGAAFMCTFSKQVKHATGESSFTTNSNYTKPCYSYKQFITPEHYLVNTECEYDDIRERDDDNKNEEDIKKT